MAHCSRTRRLVIAVVAVVTIAISSGNAFAAESDSTGVLRVLTLQDYNTRVVLFGTLLLGVTAGLVGTFTLLRRQALVGDVVSHAALPGVAVAFLAGELVSPGSG